MHRGTLKGGWVRAVPGPLGNASIKGGGSAGRVRRSQTIARVCQGAGLQGGRPVHVAASVVGGLNRRNGLRGKVACACARPLTFLRSRAGRLGQFMLPNIIGCNGSLTTAGNRKGASSTRSHRNPPLTAPAAMFYLLPFTSCEPKSRFFSSMTWAPT